MQKSTDMQSFTGVLPAIYSLCHKRKKKQLMHPMEPNYINANTNCLNLHESELKGKADKCEEDLRRTGVIKAVTNSSSEWTLVRQSSMDLLISRSSRGNPHLDVHTHCQTQIWPSIPSHMYAKLKKKMRCAFIASSSNQLQRHRSQHPHKLNVSSRVEDSSCDAAVLELTSVH
eukprot:c24438_g1_i1 orf=297-815(+)